MSRFGVTTVNSKESASDDHFQVSWLQGPKNQKKFTFKDILNYSGEGFIKVFWLLDKSDEEEVRTVLAKYNRKVTLLPLENFPVIDPKGRLQLSSKRSFSMEGLGLGSFCKLMFEKGHFVDLKKKGVKYVYLQPLTNLRTKIIDFDLLDIMLSTSQPGASGMFLADYQSNSSRKKVYHVNNQQNYANRSNNFETSKPPVTSKKSFQIFDFSQSDLMEMKSKQKSMMHLYYETPRTSRERFANTSIDHFPQEEEGVFDCISKVYDLEGEFALKIHDSPTDYLNSVKFFDPETGTNWSKLHTGECVFNLNKFLSKKFWRKYKYSKTPWPFNLK